MGDGAGWILESYANPRPFRGFAELSRILPTLLLSRWGYVNSALYQLLFASTVCRSCIVKYLQDSEDNKCPACSILIHETNPFEMLRYLYQKLQLFLLCTPIDSRRQK